MQGMAIEKFIFIFSLMPDVFIPQPEIKRAVMNPTKNFLFNSVS